MKTTPSKAAFELADEMTREDVAELLTCLALAMRALDAILHASTEDEYIQAHASAEMFMSQMSTQELH